MRRILALGISVILAQPTAASEALSGALEEAQSSFSLLSSVARSTYDSKFPRGDRELDAQVQQVLNSHLSAVERAAKKSNVTYKREKSQIEILPNQTSELNCETMKLNQTGLKKVVYEPLFLIQHEIIGAFDSKSNTMHTTLNSVASGKVDSTTHHEAVHARNWYDKSRTTDDLKLTFQSIDGKDLRQDAMSYSRFISADELSAYTEELKFMLKDPTNTSEMNPATGVTAFEDKALIMLDVVKTLEKVSADLSKAKLKSIGQKSKDANQTVTYLDNGKVKIDLAAIAKDRRRFAKVGDAEAAAKSWLSSLNKKASRTRSALENASSLEPRQLVERLEAALK